MLKSVIDSLDEVPEALRAEYKDDGGKFILLTDSTERISDFRNNNLALQASVNDLTTKVNAFGKTPEEIAAIETELAEIKAKADSSDKDKTSLAAQVEQLTAAVTKLTDENATATAALAAKTQASTIEAAATAAGANPAMLADLVAKAEREGWVIEGAELVHKTGDIVTKSDANPLNNKSVDEYFAEVFKSQPAYQADVSGAGGQQTTVITPGTTVIAANDPLALGQNAEAVAKGEAVVAPQ
jgi:hypothetical protein